MEATKLSTAQPIPRAYVLGSKARAIVEMIRPFTLIAPPFGGMSGALMSYVISDSGELEPVMTISVLQLFTALFGSLILSLVNAASNTLNAIHDEEIDRINKPTRPLVTGALTKDDAYSVAWIFYTTIMFLSALINFAFLACVFAIVLITIMYSAPPFRLKKRFWISNISIALARGFLGFMAAWCIFDATPQDNPVPWLVGTIMFLVLVGATTAKDFTDVEGDAKFGMRTLPVVYGQSKSAKISSVFLIFPFFIVPLGYLSGIFIAEALVMTALAAWGAAIAYMMTRAPSKQGGKMENSPVWGHMYFLLMTMQVGFAAVYIYAGLA